MASKLRTLIGLLGLLVIVPVADAQRGSAGDFEGVWRGTLNMFALFGIPEEHVERLSKPVELEMRFFARGGAELYFTFEEDEWEFTQQRDFRITLIGDNNAVVEARTPGLVEWQNSLSFNMALRGEDQLLLSWTRLTTRDQLRNDGLDEMGFAGSAIMQRVD